MRVMRYGIINQGEGMSWTSNAHTWRDPEVDIVYVLLVLACHQPVQRHQPGNRTPSMNSLSMQGEILLSRPRNVGLLLLGRPQMLWSPSPCHVESKGASCALKKLGSVSQEQTLPLHFPTVWMMQWYLTWQHRVLFVSPDLPICG